jgi:tetratricopeptide (TPR) repeat protein
MILFLGAVLALGAPFGLSGPAEERWARAQVEEKGGFSERAARLYESIWRSERHVDAAVAAAVAWKEAGRAEVAVGILEEAGGDPDATAALAVLLWDLNRQDAACDLADRGRLAWSDVPDFWWLGAMCTADADPETSSQLAEVWLGFSVHRELDPTRAHQLARAQHGAALRRGDLREASAAIARVVQRIPGTVRGLAALQDETSMRERARKLAYTANRPLDSTQRDLLIGARRWYRAGDLERASSLIEELGRRVPWNAEVRGARAEIREARGQYAEAEADLRVAEELDPLDPRWPERRGRLLIVGFGGRDAAEIVASWDRSLALAPERPSLWLEKAHWEAVLGRRDAALASLRRAQALEANEETARRIEALQRDVLRVEAIPGGRACPGGVSEAACEGYYLAVAWQRRADPGDAALGRDADLDLAWAEIARVRGLSPRWVAPVNLQASLRRARGGDPVAVRREVAALWEESLSLDPEQGEVALALGRLHREGGDLEAARRAWGAAIDLPGGAPAHLELARLDLEADDLAGARLHLEALADSSAELDPDSLDLAERLQREIERRDFWRWVAVLGPAGVVASALAMVMAWFRRGVTVEAWLDRDPRARPEIARLAGSIKHEILKHHTAWLGTTAEALIAGDGGPALFLADRLYGDGGALARLDAYVHEVEAFARASGVVLALRTRDPVFVPLYRASRRLKRVESGLRAGNPAVAPALREVARVLQDRVEPGLSRLARVRERCIVDSELLQEVVKRTVSEPAWQYRRPPVVSIAATAAGSVGVARADLADAVGNLVRNALQASSTLGTPVKVSAYTEEDPATLLESVVVRVADHAPGRPDPLLLRSQAADRGLGMVRELVVARGGSVEVEDEPGFTKALVLRLPRVPEEGG